MKTKSRKNVTPKFDNQTRFNWGFHDATLAVEQGWAIPENNFGFAHHGPLAGLRSTLDILARHFDRTYAEGWMAGYIAMETDETPRPNSSEPFWLEALADGRVTA